MGVGVEGALAAKTAGVGVAVGARDPRRDGVGRMADVGKGDSKAAVGAAGPAAGRPVGAVVDVAMVAAAGRVAVTGRDDVAVGKTAVAVAVDVAADGVAVAPAAREGVAVGRPVAVGVAVRVATPVAVAVGAGGRVDVTVGVAVAGAGVLPAGPTVAWAIHST